MREGAGPLALAALVVLAGCGDDVERSTRSVCGEAVEVAVRGDDVTAESASASVAGEWRLTWRPDGGDDLTVAVGPLPLEAADTADGTARLTTPDAGCTALLGVAPLPVRVLGDSLAFQVAAAGLADWQGTPGAAWAQVTDDPASSALDEARGAVADEPSVLVLQFGANDALWVAGSDDAGVRLAAVTDAVDRLLAETASVPCVRVVTPSAGRTVIFDLGARYEDAANRVAEIIRAAVPHESIADWTAASAAHHLPDGTDGDWFVDGDEIHPNDAGRAALVALVEEAVATC
jgi:lysophospholipase L1-like esterase